MSLMADQKLKDYKKQMLNIKVLKCLTAKIQRYCYCTLKI